MMLKKQRGVFAIELSFILFFIFALLLFTGDLAFKIFNRVALDRASYSLVNIIKERQRFYEGRIHINKKDINEINLLASRLLIRKLPFGLQVQSLYKGLNKSLDVNSGCGAPPISKSLVPENISGTGFPVYQVSLCYDFQNWFDKFLGSKKKNRLQSDSVMVGR